jgi:hypothetical protein
MKSCKMLMMAAFTILSCSLFAQTPAKGHVIIHQPAAINYPCAVSSNNMMTAGVTNEAFNVTAHQLSPKEKMKMDVAHINYNVANAGTSSNYGLNLSAKEQLKAATMNISLRSSVSDGKISICPICHMNVKDMAFDCCSSPEKSAGKMAKTPGCRTNLHLSPKEKMKVDMLRI